MVSLKFHKNDESSGQFSSLEWLTNQAVKNHKEGRMAEAISCYLEVIDLDNNSPPWIYGNAITLLAQNERFKEGLSLGNQGLEKYPDFDEILRAIGILFHQQNNLAKAEEFYSKSIEQNSDQPEWVYLHSIKILIQSKNYERANELQQKAIIQFPESKYFEQFTDLELSAKEQDLFRNISYVDLDSKSLFTVSDLRETPQDVEAYVDLDISSIRRQLMDSAVVEQYQIILEQILFSRKEGNKKMDYDALVYCLAEIKTDIHYLKTKLSHPDPESLDPQAKDSIDLDQITSLCKPIPIKCDFKERIVGSGWYDAEEHGRWSGPGRVSSVVLSCPLAGSYRLEIIVRGEANSEILKTLSININDCPLETDIVQSQNSFFPAVVTGELIIAPEEDKSFLVVDFIIGETVMPLETDSRLIGLLVEKISLIPRHINVDLENES